MILKRESVGSKALAVLLSFMLLFMSVPYGYAYAGAPDDPIEESTEPAADLQPSAGLQADEGLQASEKTQAVNSEEPATPESVSADGSVEAAATEGTADNPETTAGGQQPASVPASSGVSATEAPAATSKEFTDSETGVKVVVNASAERIAALDGATLQVKKGDGVPDAAEQKKAFADALGTASEIELYEIKVLVGGQEFSMAASESATVEIPSAAEGQRAYRMEDGALKTLEASFSSNKLTVKTDKLGVVALVAPAQEGTVEMALQTASVESDSTAASGHVLGSTPPASLPAAEAHTAPYSSVDSLEAGEYYVNANIVIFAKDNQIIDGLTVYMLSDDFPPLTPRKDKKFKMTVDENGKARIHLILNTPPASVFTLQSVSSSDNLTVIDGSVIRNNGSEKYGKPIEYGPDYYTGEMVEGRVAEFTVELGNLGGVYTFGPSTQFNDIVPYSSIVKTYRDMPMYFFVDLASAEKQRTVEEDEQIFSFTDETSGVSLAAFTSNASAKAALTGSTLAVKTHNDDEVEAGVNSQLDSIFADRPATAIYEVSLVGNDGKELAFGDEVGYTLTVPDDRRYPRAYLYDKTSGTMESLAGVTQKKDALEIVLPSLGVVVAAETNACRTWLEKSWSDEATGVSAYDRIAHEGQMMGTHDDFALQVKVKEYFTGKLYYVDFLDTVYGLQTMGMGSGSMLDITVPLTSDNDKVYRVTWKDGARSITTEPVSVVDGKATIHFVTSEMSSANYVKASAEVQALKDAYNGEPDASDSFTGLGYGFLVSSKSFAVDPEIMENLTYTGIEQIGVVLDETTELVSGDLSATHAGTYTATYKPKDGYEWPEGGTGAKTISWTIGKAPLRFEYVKYLPYTTVDPTAEWSTPEALKQIADEIVYTGFVNGESAESARNFERLTVTSGPTFVATRRNRTTVYSPASLSTNYIAQNNRSDTDYSFTGVVYMVIGMSPEDEMVLSTPVEGLVYNGSSQYGYNRSGGSALKDKGFIKAGNQHVDLNGNNYSTGFVLAATNAGNYTYALPIKEQQGVKAGAWSDGSIETKYVNWSIAPAPLTATVQDKVIDVWTGDPVDLDVDVQGFVADETAGTLWAYGDYTAPVASFTGEDAEIVPGGTYQVSASGGKSSNYEFNYVPGTVTVSKVQIEVPAAAEGLVETGEELVGVSEGAHYKLTGTYKASKAGTYTATVTPNDGYVWPDGASGAKEITWSIAAESVTPATDGAKLKPGTYTVSANMYLKASDAKAAGFPLLALIAGDDGAAYMTNPANPLGKGGVEGVPTTPVSNNAKLVVAEDGTMKLTVPIANPVFTMQRLGLNSQLGVTNVATTSKDGPFGACSTRISEITVTLPSAEDADYVFEGAAFHPGIDGISSQYGVITVPLHLAVGGVSSLPKSNADSGTVDDVINGNTGSGSKDSGKATGGSSSGKPAAESSGQSKTTVAAANTAGAPGVSGHLAAGTYTVSANIWFDRSVTGLPLNPHLTNGGFPPMNPVEGNATLRVDENGHAWVTVPIVIQGRIMTVNSISGLAISDYTSGDGLSSVTIDLGVLDASTSVVRQGCTVSVTIGDLAMTIGGAIFQGERNHTWPATFELNFSGVPASGGGTVPPAALAIMNGEQSASSVEAVAEAEDAASDAAADAAAEAKAKRGNAHYATAGEGADVIADDANALAAGSAEGATDPWRIAIPVAAAVVVVGLAWWLFAKRRKKDDEEEQLS